MQFGLGYRSQHAGEIAAAPRAVDWFEVLVDAGLARDRIERLRADHPLALHGVHLSIAGSDPVDSPYLRDLCALAGAIDPAFVSDHLCWTSRGGHHSHDLLPVAYTEEVLDHVAARVDAVQERLGRRLLLENASAYVAFRADAIDEAEFFAALCRRTGCGMLLDVNNLYVNAMNLGIDPGELPRDDSRGRRRLSARGRSRRARRRPHRHPRRARSRRGVGPLRACDGALPGGAGDPRARRPDPAVRRAASKSSRSRAHDHAAATPEAAPRPAAASRSAPARWDAVQKDFFERVVDKPLGFDHAGVETLLDDARPVRAARGMRVYSDAYTAGLRRALATNFPALARVLRGDDFDSLAAAYLRAHPPRSHAFHALGAALPGFLREHALAASYAVAREALADVAALEQAQLEAQFAAPPAGASAITAEDLAAIAADDWDDVRFAFRADLRVVRATHAVGPAVEAAARGEDPPRPQPGPTAWLVYRVGDKVRSERCDPDEAFVLARLADGDAFGAACDALAAHCADLDAAEVATTAVRGIASLCGLGLVARIRP